MKENKILGRIRLVSHLLRLGCWIALAGLLFITAAAFWKPENAKIGEIPLTVMLRSHLGFTVTAWVATSLYLLVWLALLIRLFRCYEKGQVFARGTVRHIKRIGLLVFVGTIGSFVIKAASFQMGISSAPVEVDLGGIVYGVLILLIGWIMEQGAALQEENDLTV